MKYLLLFLFLPLVLFASPFEHDLCLTRIPGPSQKTLICFHGMGGNWQICDVVKVSAKPGLSIVSFNFPDHGLRRGVDISRTAFGTIRELLPAIYVLKTCICDEGLTRIDLYGYSAGGGAIVNILAVLNSNTHDFELQLLGVGEKEKAQILKVIQKGVILLDTPLKSVEEIVAFRGKDDPGLALIAERYKTNHMEPMNAIEKLHNLALNVVIHFENPDLVLSNRDDDLYIEKFKKYNTLGTTTICHGFSGGHSLPHPPLWKFYNER